MLRVSVTRVVACLSTFRAREYAGVRRYVCARACVVVAFGRFLRARVIAGIRLTPHTALAASAVVRCLSMYTLAKARGVFPEGSRYQNWRRFLTFFYVLRGRVAVD